MYHFMEDKVLFSQVRHSTLSLMPFILPELNCECLVLSVQEGLSVPHLKDFIDGLLFDLLLFVSPSLRHLDLLISHLIRHVQCRALFEICLFKRFDPFLFALHHA